MEISETLVSSSAVMWLIVVEDFSTFICDESFKSYVIFPSIHLEVYVCHNVSDPGICILNELRF
jgi:hypothetical protein